MNNSSRKRVLDAISHKQPDRLPVDLWAEPEVIDKLLKYYNTDNWNHVLDILEVDIRTISPVYPPLVYENEFIRRNQWGERWKKLNSAGIIRRELCITHRHLMNLKTTIGRAAMTMIIQRLQSRLMKCLTGQYCADLPMFGNAQPW